jgi:outer membrane protein
VRITRNCLCLALAATAIGPIEAQTVLKLTLQEAREIAIQRHPEVQAALLTARAADQAPDQQEAAAYPTVESAVTGAGASKDAALAAGALSNSTVLSRAAAGFSVNQLLFDFGRNGSLVESARLRAQAAHQTATAIRAKTVLEVDQAYFTVLRAQALFKVSEQTVATRKLVVDQTEALQKHGIKSGLDVSIARYDVAESELLLVKSQNDLRAAFAALSAALGSDDEHVFELADEPLPRVPLPDQSEILIAGLRDRPELKALQFERAAAYEFLEAEKSLDRPTVTAIWSAGWIPFRDPLLRDAYNAAAINISIPIFEGRLFRAREAEAHYRAQAWEQQLKNAVNGLVRDVRIARLNAETAYRRIDLAAQSLERAREALELAQERYRLGLGSMVELRQTLLSVTVAEIENASAKFEFLIQRSVLDYEGGQLQ